MKYSDIPQFTSWGSYQVNMPLKYIKQRIEEWIAEDRLQLNPDFQRGHVWTDEQQVNYIEFLLKGGQSSRVIYFNHPGWMTGFKGDFVCVDGLQRLTAVMRYRFLVAIIKILRVTCQQILIYFLMLIILKLKKKF